MESAGILIALLRGVMFNAGCYRAEDPDESKIGGRSKEPAALEN
jgi:hypothetical protein